MLRPSSVRLPPRFKTSMQRASSALREVDHEVVRRAFLVWDVDNDGRISAEDLVAFARKARVPGPDDLEAHLVDVVREAMERTGFARAVCGKKGAVVREESLTVPDVVAACSFRVRPGVSKAWLPRPFRETWIALIRAAMETEKIFQAPQPFIFAPPPMTQPERAQLAALHNYPKTISLAPRDLRQLPKSMRALDIFAATKRLEPDPVRPHTADAVLCRKGRPSPEPTPVTTDPTFCGFEDRRKLLDSRYYPKNKTRPETTNGWYQDASLFDGSIKDSLSPAAGSKAKLDKRRFLTDRRDSRVPCCWEGTTNIDKPAHRSRPVSESSWLVTAHANLRPRFVVSPVSKPTAALSKGHSNATIDYNNLCHKPLYDRVATHPTIVAFHRR